MKRYKHIFFDLDRTLWDFDKAAIEKYNYIYNKYKLIDFGVTSASEFSKVFRKHNEILWALYRKGEIIKEKLSKIRFEYTLKDFGIKNSYMAVNMADDYLKINPDKIFLFPYTIEILEFLHSDYNLHLITNGFEEVQTTKIQYAGLKKYFNTFTTSEEAGVKKPDPGIFYYSLEKASARIEDSIMVGDDLDVDISGARNIGIDQVYFNFQKLSHNDKVTYEINDLSELKKIFI